jgi:hypothetical protein
MINKKALIVAASLSALPLTAVLIAVVTRRARQGSLQRSRLLRQTMSESPNAATGPTSITQNQPQKEEPESHLRSESLRQGSEAVKMTATSATSAAYTSNNVTDSEKDIPIPVVLAVTVPSPIEPSSSSAGSAGIASNLQTSKKEEISISDEAKKAGESLKELIVGAIKDAKNSAKGTGKRLKEETVDIAATSDSKDIQSLRSNVSTLVGLFERMMIEIRKENYDEQIKLLQSYKDLIQTQIKVVNARGVMASKLKPGA